jgi:SAM-dependent methyltransferase
MKGDGIAGKRSTTDFAGSSTRRLKRRSRIHTQSGGDMPDREFQADTAKRSDTPATQKAVYGQFPRGLIAKILPHLRCARHEILHVCSGSLPRGEGIRVDIRAAAKPDVIADGRNLPFADNSIAAVMEDPPYTEGYAKSLYGIDYPRPSHLLREAVRVVRPGGRICFVHYITPKPPRGAIFIKAWALSTGFDMPVRAISLYEKVGRQHEIAGLGC